LIFGNLILRVLSVWFTISVGIPLIFFGFGSLSSIFGVTFEKSSKMYSVCFIFVFSFGTKKAFAFLRL
jgi:hypothetical protein